MIYGGGGYLVPRASSVIVGATSEDVGLVHGTTAEGLSALRAIGSEVVALLTHAPVIDHWAGFRPVTPDALPILDRDPDQTALFYACGYSRNGVLFAPWAAERVADLMATGRPPADLEPFALSRFAPSS